MNQDEGKSDNTTGTLGLIEGRTLSYFRKPSRFAKQPTYNTKALYVRNMPYKTEEWQLEELFEKYGEIRNIHLNKDRETGLPRGMGFVYFQDEGPAERAAEEVDGTDFGGRYMRCSMALNK